MTFPRQGNGGPDGRPLCWNRQREETFLVQDGWLGVRDESGVLTRIPIMVYIPNRFSTECKSWAGHEGTPPVPLAEGWKCEGCKHYPAKLVAEALIAQEARG